MLLDSNVWRGLADSGLWLSAAAICRKRHLRLQVAPSVVYEALRSADPALRQSLCALLTQAQWARLMPEAYYEAMEFTSEAARLQPSSIRTGHMPLWAR